MPDELGGLELTEFFQIVKIILLYYWPLLIEICVGLGPRKFCLFLPPPLLSFFRYLFFSCLGQRLYPLVSEVSSGHAGVQVGIVVEDLLGDLVLKVVFDDLEV